MFNQEAGTTTVHAAAASSMCRQRSMVVGIEAQVTITPMEPFASEASPTTR